MVQVVIGVGSNIEREKNICVALNALTKQFGELVISPVYESLANLAHESERDPSPYFNLVVAFETSETLTNVKHCLQRIEVAQGRVRDAVVVSLDLDLLLYGDWVGELEGNAIPHHDITRCEYVLRPLTDIYPEKMHPVYSKAYSVLWSEFEKQNTTKAVDFVWNDCIVSNASFLPPF